MHIPTMSRLIVKNLPSNVTVDKLKEKFSEKGRVTDVQLKYTPAGKFRKFGFVGFQTEEEAQSALDFFHNSFYNTSKLCVEFCAELGDEKKPKAWSKYAPDSSAYQKIHKNEEEEKKKVIEPKKDKSKLKSKLDEKLVAKLNKYKHDPDFVAFLEAEGKTKVLEMIRKDLDSGCEDEDDTEEKNDEEPKKEVTSVAHAPISDSEYLRMKTKGQDTSIENLKVESPVEATKPKDEVERNLFTVKLKNLPYSAKKKDIKEFMSPLVPASIRLVPKVKGIAYVGFKTDKLMRQALVKNKGFLGGKQINVVEYKEKKPQDEPDRWKEQKDALKNEESIIESGRIFVRNLAYTVTEQELQDLFATYGPVTEAVVPVDRLSRQVKGFGVITYLMPEHAVAAYTALDGTIFHGRMLHLLPGKPKDSPTDENEDGPYKLKKEKKLKATAQLSHTWNTLFLGQNAVAEVIAEKYNASKQEVMTGKNAAVRMALGETQIVSETKQFLEDNGVALDAFNQEVTKRSKTVILVKNLPAKTTAAEIRDVFAKHGELGRVILPPSGVTAIVEFLEPSEARSAFKRVAYSKFKHVPLYLEWAPDNTFVSSNGGNKKTQAIDSEAENVENSGNVGNSVNEEKNVVEKKKESEDEDLVPEPDTTIFVKNLNFSTTEEILKNHFSNCGKIASVSIARKKHASQPGTTLSMGYGFVQFYAKSSATQALKVHQGSELEGHTLELKRSNRTLQTEAINERKKTNVKVQTGTKIMVRNIPFQATIKEVAELFRAFGELKSIRIPKKMVGTGPHRGFGFIEYVTKHDAKRAMKTLAQSTHLFGRRLVLEWAETDESVETIRKRTAKHFHPDAGAVPSKKATADIEIEEMQEEEVGYF